MGGTDGRRRLKRILIGLAVVFVAVAGCLLWLLSELFSRGQTDQEYAGAAGSDLRNDTRD